MKKVIIVHGWGGSPQKNWMPWVKQELEKLGFEVTIPAMPSTDLPELSLWLPKLSETIGTPNEDLYLIGHSLGCITIIRYLETLPENQKVGGLVLVAGFTSDDLSAPELKNFFETPVNFAKVKQAAKKFTAIHSTNDPYVSLKHGDIFQEKLGAEVIIKHNMDHFSNPKDDEKNSILLQEIIESMIKDGR